MEELIQDVQGAITQLEGLISSLPEKAASGMAGWPWWLDWLKGSITALIDALGRLLNLFLESIKHLIGDLGMWFVLDDRAHGWVELSKSLKSVSHDLQPSQLINDVDWAGAAATSYRNAVNDQAGAVDEIRTFADTMSSIMEDAKSAAGNFDAGLFVTIVLAIGAGTGATAACATGIGAVIGVPVAITDAGAASAAVAALVATVGSAIKSELSEIDKARLGAEALTKWPEGVAN